MITKNRVKKLEDTMGGDWQEYERRFINLWGALNERFEKPFDPEKIRQSVREKMKKYKTPENIQLSPLGKEILQKHGIEVD
jgi:hypothetical protein